VTVCTIAYLAALLRLLSHSCLQLTFTALHLLGFVSPNEDPSLKDFLIKKASVLEDWLKSLCTSFNNSEHQTLPTEAINDEDGFSPNVTQKVMLSSAVRSLLGIYAGRNQQAITQRFEQLAASVAGMVNSHWSPRSINKQQGIGCLPLGWTAHLAMDF